MRTLHTQRAWSVYSYNMNEEVALPYVKSWYFYKLRPHCVQTQLQYMHCYNSVTGNI